MKRFVVFLFASLAFAAVASAQSQVNGLWSMNYPARVDINRNGIPDGTDTAVYPEAGAITNTVVIRNPWDPTPDGTNTFQLENLTGGRWQGGSRALPAVQRITVGAVSGDTPTLFDFEELDANPDTGQGQLVDLNSDGIWDGLRVTRGTSFVVPFVYIDTTNDGWADMMSFPWAQMSALGVDFKDGQALPGPGITDPQVWMPMADTNNDGRGDGLGVDINNDRYPDPQFFLATNFGPVAAAATAAATSIPTAGEWGLLLVTLMLAAAGVFHLRRIAV